MEYMAFQRSLTFLHDNGLPITTFVSDRHASIAKHMKEKLPQTHHYFDLWHLAKSELIKTLYWILTHPNSYYFTDLLYDTFIHSVQFIGLYLLFWRNSQSTDKNIFKLKGCEALVDWIKPCEKHFYWSATSTTNDDGNVIWAKFKSFLSHIHHKHSDLDEPLFNKCAHETTIPQWKWLLKGILILYHI